MKHFRSNHLASTPQEAAARQLNRCRRVARRLKVRLLARRGVSAATFAAFLAGFFWLSRGLIEWSEYPSGRADAHVVLGAALIAVWAAAYLPRQRFESHADSCVCGLEARAAGLRAWRHDQWVSDASPPSPRSLIRTLSAAEHVWLKYGDSWRVGPRFERQMRSRLSAVRREVELCQAAQRRPGGRRE